MSKDPTRLHDPDEHEQQEIIDPIENPQSTADERRRAAFVVPHKLLISVMLLLLVYLVAAALGIEITIFSTRSGETANPTPTRLYGNEGASGQSLPRDPAAASDSTIAPLGAESQPIERYLVDPLFQGYWEQNGAVRIFGHPISPLMTTEGGRQIQWFERARLEHWPDLAGAGYAIQSGLVGVEYTEGVDFPQQQFFPSQPDHWFFSETGHAVKGLFLQFWLRHGGLKTFGYPISEEIREVLPSDGQVHIVQYFERARMEYHPELAGTEHEIELGLLGRALYLQEDRPAIVRESLIAPTPVPLQR